MWALFVLAVAWVRCAGLVNMFLSCSLLSRCCPPRRPSPCSHNIGLSRATPMCKWYSLPGVYSVELSSAAVQRCRCRCMVDGMTIEPTSSSFDDPPLPSPILRWDTCAMYSGGRAECCGNAPVATSFCAHRCVGRGCSIRKTAIRREHVHKWIVLFTLHAYVAAWTL